MHSCTPPVDEYFTEVMTKGVEIAEHDFRGLVVHHQGENFSAGANLLMILFLAVGALSLPNLMRETFPERPEGAEIHYLDDNRTCVLPVRLEPDKTYVLWMNRGRFNSFRDADNNPAVPYLLVFRTKGE